ncbi:hypothetical protein DM867_04730 [Halosegnis rubeus]|jgi:hypothetical protein|uniref:DUF7282 domain-containing protein n=1 Tax=Halosegnis rubeus TaxID=2212850 RepID=A0A5N5UCS7_9EURY|nr:hypothetical protein [Halosegnis rubeus]KAB7516423.1 hypothetical protein DM867_04730 [Halosegnis rubeus]KAB7517588.1 hypothetical protein DP108_08390 [Halosegnis rubeus]
MRRVVATLAVVLVLASVPLPVAAHANHVTAGTQVSPDGTLVVDSVYLTSDGYLTVHRDDDGEPGERIGVTEVPARSFQPNVHVTVDETAWAEWEPQSVHLVLRSDDGDGTFEPDEDPAIESFGSPVAASITVAAGERAVVAADQHYLQQTRRGTLDVRHLATPTEGYLVVTDHETGERVGTEAIEAGSHEHVTVALDGSDRGETRLDATLYREDETGGIGEPIRAGNASVGATFTVERLGGGRQAAATATATPNLVRTPSEPTETATETAGPTTATTVGSQPGFGLLTTVGALVLVAGRWRA